MDISPIIDPIIRGKASKSYVLITFFICFVLNAIITNGPNWIAVVHNRKPNPPILGQTTVIPDQAQAIDESKDPNNLLEQKPSCISLVSPDKYAVDTQYKFLNKTGDYYYPTGTGNTWEGILWIKKIIGLKFKNIFVEYEVIPIAGSEKPPSLIFLISKNATEKTPMDILKIWVPEYSERSGDKYLQILGLAKNIDFSLNELKREQGLVLPDAVKVNQTNSIKIASTSISGNEMSINVLYDYTSDRTGMAIESPFSTQLKFPFSNLEDTNEKLDLGIGTYKGNKFRIVSLSICY